MTPTSQSHASYQQFVLKQLRQHYSGGVLTLVANDWPLIAKCWITDLSVTGDFLRPHYGKRGPKPTDPDKLLRAFLVMLQTGETSITKWVDSLRRIPLYAIISGFEPGNTPGIGTFYDFAHRFWNRDALHLNAHLQPKRQKPEKGKNKGEKSPMSVDDVYELVQKILREGPAEQAQPFDPLFDFFQSQILSVSARLGLLGDLRALSVSGDGSPLVTSAYPRSKPTCDCRAQGLKHCDHDRFYSQPDCDSGWDSSRERYFNGYNQYVFTASSSLHDLPLFPRLFPGSRHDAVGLVISATEFLGRFSLGTVNRMILDSAHDALGIYELLIHHDIEPFIDLNPRGRKKDPRKGEITISPQGVPICPIGKEMRPNGFERRTYRQKWRCPLARGTDISCPTPCSTAKYGRTFHTYPKENPRLFPAVPRGTEAWEMVYKRRTTVERSHKRAKIDYELERGKHRSTAMWYFRIYGIMMCEHIDAWYCNLKDDLDLESLIFG